MKSLNTKKIVAMATGAALLGSALLGAVSYQNTELINDNGVPMAKVVVGSNAHISDGVAAANIAAVLGNMAFKSVAVSATVDGVAGLSCDVSGDSAGTCAVLSKSVDLEVVTPAGVIPAGAYGIHTYIDDYMDDKPLDRADDDLVDFPQEGNVAAKKVKAADYAGLADYAVKDPQSSFTTVESQFMYVRSETGKELYYDVAEDVFTFEGVQFAYELEFESPGIPVCSSKTNGEWVDCKYYNIDTDKQMENHRMKIKFLGEEWIISEMDPQADTIKIAKESAYSPKLQIGEDLDLGDGNKLVLGDLKPASGNQVADIAIFSVLNAAGEEIASKTVAAGATNEITAGSATYRVRVYQVAPGYTLTEKWAEVAVFANELELEDGQKLDDEDNSEWRAYLEWKMEGTEDDHLYKVQLVSEYFEDTMIEGGSYTIVENPGIWRFTFTGLDLTDSDYANVDFTLQNRMNFWLQEEDSNPLAANKRVFGDGTLTTNVAVKMSSTEKVFEVADKDGDLFEVKTVYFSPFGYYDADTATYKNQAIVAFEHDKNGVFMVDDIATAPVKLLVGDDDYDVRFFWSDDDGADFVEVDQTVTAQNLAAIDDYAIVFAENNDEATYSYVAVNARETDVASNKLELNNEQDDAEDIMYWADATTPATFADTDLEAMYIGEFVETPFYTQKGTYVQSASESRVKIRFAKEVGKLTFLLQATGATASESGAMTYSNLHEGDSIDVLGATVTVKAIDCETGACTTGAASGTVTGIEGLSCKLNANVANLGERQDIPTDLVIMDNAATNVETVIAVGGPMVNTITEALLAGESPLGSAGDVYVAEVGAGKIVVAGYTADDTMTAARNFIATLKGQ